MYQDVNLWTVAFGSIGIAIAIFAIVTAAVLSVSKNDEGGRR